jgi:hypothetical protein
MHSRTLVSPRKGRPSTFDPERAIVFDLEVYPARWVVGFLGRDEKGRMKALQVGTRKALGDRLEQFAAEGRTLVGYNSMRFDGPLVRLILAGHDPYAPAQSIIKEDKLPDALAKLPPLDCDHVDLALRLSHGGAFPGLKTLAARLGRPTLRELPYDPTATLSGDEWAEVKRYNLNDLDTTWAVLERLAPELEALATLSEEYRMDLRSVPTPRVVERVFLAAYRERHGQDPARIIPHEVRYRPVEGVVRPATPAAAEWFDAITTAAIPMVQAGDRKKPQAPSARFEIGGLTLSVGSGGIHSVDSPCVYYADEGHRLLSIDVASYYPTIIASKGITPASYGDTGSDQYHKLLKGRLEVKAALKAVPADQEDSRSHLARKADGLKLMLNSFFGQLGNPYSTLHDPAAFMAVTLTGQLMLIDLVERLSGCGGVEVISVNTDGIYARVPAGSDEWKGVLERWQTLTGMTLEVEELRRLGILSTNQYCSLDARGAVKRKGGELLGSFDLAHSSNALIVNDAIVEALLRDVPPEVTIFACRDLVRFCAITKRTESTTLTLVEGESRTDLPKVTRWFRADDGGRIEIGYPDGHTSTPPHARCVTICQDLPDDIPLELHFAAYVVEARKKVHGVAGYRHCDRALLGDHPLATRVLDSGLVPAPKWGKEQAPGSDHRRISLLYNWAKVPTVGCYTGPDVGVMVVDVDDPERWRKYVDKGNDPLFADRWGTLAAALVSCHGEATAEGVRSGADRGKLIFAFSGGPDHPLLKCKARWKKTRGVEVFYGTGMPSVLGRYGENGDSYRLEGALTEAPDWLVEALSPKVREKPPAAPATTPEERREALQGLPALLAELCPELGGESVRWRLKDTSAGDRWVGGCPFAADHDSGRGGSGDLDCGFHDDDGLPYVRCVHASCAQVKEVNRRLKEEWRRDHPPEERPEERPEPEAPAREPGVNGKPREWKLLTTKLSSYKPEPVEYLIEPYIYKAKINLMAGPAGVGKSTLIYDEVASLSRGRPAFGLDYAPCEPMDILILAGEEAYTDTIVPRLMALGADLDRIRSIDGVGNRKGERRAFHLGLLDVLKDELEACPSVGLVLMDPITSPISQAGANQNDEAEVRILLERLKLLAEQTGVTFQAVKNFNKDEARSAAARVSGTHAYVDVCRANYVIDRDPDNRDGRILSIIKVNGPEEPSPFAFHLMAVPAPEAAALVAGCTHLDEKRRAKLAAQLRRVVYDGKSHYTADDLVKKKQAPESSAARVAAAKKWLADRLKGGPVGSVLCSQEGDIFLNFAPIRADLDPDERRRSILGRVKWWREAVLKKELGGKTRKLDFNGQWYFVLPGHTWPPSAEAICAAEAAERATDTKQQEPEW